MTVSITFPCGCEINEASVVAMCVKHVHELREKRIRERRHEAERERQVHEWFDQIIRERRG
jgi:hypothetical protein